MEKRKTVRIKTHSAVKLVSSRGLKLIYGYLDNISETGMGIVSPEQIMTGSRFTCGFFLGNNVDKINTIATMVHVAKGNDSINYYGFRFDYISSTDHQMISGFVETEGVIFNN
jgi:c-di-GMP-binding flagellar brake protein YcgR